MNLELASLNKRLPHARKLRYFRITGAALLQREKLSLNKKRPPLSSQHWLYLIKKWRLVRETKGTRHVGYNTKEKTAKRLWLNLKRALKAIWRAKSLTYTT